MSKILFKALRNYRALRRTSFHTPGHKGVMINNADFFGLDYTELPFTDSLYECSGIIKQSEEELSKLYGSKRSLLSCGGNTLCIQTMIRLCAPSGGKILCDRIAHRSAVSAFGLLGIDPVWIERKIDLGSGLPKRIKPEEVEKHLIEQKDIKAVYLTSPDYYGIMQDIKAIAQVCREYDVPLMVDNAHGSHLKFLNMDLHPIEQGATMSADSAHKTLPVLTGGAWLHINDERFCKDAKNAMALFGSTSPSYSIMASMDVAQNWLFDNGISRYKELAEKVSDMRNLARESGFYIPDEGICDPCRITLGTWRIGVTGEEFRDFLYRFKIEPEFCDKNYVVLIPTPFNTRVDWSRLRSAIKRAKDIADKKLDISSVLQIDLPKKVKTVRESIMGEIECMAVEDAVGRVAAEIACPCPPGVPLVMPGELIGEKECNALINYGVSEINVIK